MQSSSPRLRASFTSFCIRYSHICDGESQGTDGINYSQVSREMIANMIEIQANATPFDAGVFIASCDKGMPGSLMGMCRMNIPGVMVPGGVMNAGPELLTLEQLGKYSAQYERGEIGEERLNWAKANACPGFGACSFIGTASTMQIMAEALGLALPGSALLPADSPDLLNCAYEAGKQAVRLARQERIPYLVVVGEREAAARRLKRSDGVPRSLRHILLVRCTGRYSVQCTATLCHLPSPPYTSS